MEASTSAQSAGLAQELSTIPGPASFCKGDQEQRSRVKARDGVGLFESWSAAVGRGRDWASSAERGSIP
jgi:hypothetical protein